MYDSFRVPVLRKDKVVNSYVSNAAHCVNTYVLQSAMVKNHVLQQSAKLRYVLFHQFVLCRVLHGGVITVLDE